MNDRIKEAFDQIHADEGLKDRTRAFIAQQTAQYADRGGARRRHDPDGRIYCGLRAGSGIGRLTGRGAARIAVSAAVCVICFLLGVGGYHVYFTATSVISIDINPSIELGINRFDRVISVEGYNDDGRRLAESLDVRFMEYSRALEKILENESVVDYLAKDELLSVVVVESDEEKSRMMLSNVETCVSGHGKAHCHSTGTGTVAGAHAAGLSYGKYLAFLELQALDPEITVQDVQGMTMREIREMILRLLPEGSVGDWLEDLPADGHHEEEVLSEDGHHEEEVLSEDGYHEEEAMSEDGHHEEEVLSEDGHHEEEVLSEDGHHEEEAPSEGGSAAEYGGGSGPHSEAEHKSGDHGHGHGKE